MNSLIILGASNVFLIIIFAILISIYLRNGFEGKKVRDDIKKIKEQISK